MAQDWGVILVSLTFILLSLAVLYYQHLYEILCSIRVALQQFRGLASNEEARVHLYRGWIPYLFGVKHEFGYGSGSTALDIATDNIDNLWNKTIIVTGGNSGIGLSICTALSAVSHEQSERVTDSNERTLERTPCCIIMASRNVRKSEIAITKILRQYPGANIRCMGLDLSSSQSIVRFMKSLKALPRDIEENICVLINNAGVAMGLKARSIDFDDRLEERMERHFTINHVGPFVLTQFIVDTYFKNTAKECRVVCVSSIMHRVTSSYSEMSQFTRYHLHKEYDHVMAYGQSKLCNVVHATMMAQEWKDRNIVINSCHPGNSIESGLAAGLFTFDSTTMFRLAYLVMGFLWKTNDQCAATPMMLACDPRISSLPCGQLTGRYFRDCTEIQPNKCAEDDDFAKKLKAFSIAIYEKIKNDIHETPLEPAS